jgi:hypothetical protein
LVCSQLGLHSNKVVTLGGDFFGHAHLIPTWSVKTVCDRGVCSLQPDSLQRGCPHVGIVCERESIVHLSEPHDQFLLTRAYIA